MTMGTVPIVIFLIINIYLIICIYFSNLLSVIYIYQ